MLEILRRLGRKPQRSRSNVDAQRSHGDVSIGSCCGGRNGLSDRVMSTAVVTRGFSQLSIR